MSAITDLINTMSLGLPLASQWNVGGYPWAWHVQQVRDGHRVVPSIHLHGVFETAAPSLYAASDDFDYVNTNGLPFRLRTNNLQLDFFEYAFPETAEADSPLVLWDDNGTVKDVFPTQPVRLVDRLGDPERWHVHGALWASRVFTQGFQARLPTPAWISLMENNEVGDDRFIRYTANTGSDLTALGYHVVDWEPSLETLSISLAALVVADDPDPNVYPVQWAILRKAQFVALYEGFNDGCVAGWDGKIYSGGYGEMTGDAQNSRPALDAATVGYSPDALSYDAPGPFLYINAPHADFTQVEQADVLNLIPAWEWMADDNPKHYREFLVQILPKAIATAKNAGIHEVMTPARYEGYIQWLYWSFRGSSRAVMITQYTPNSYSPDDLFFDTQSALDLLESAGASDIAGLTHGDYFEALTGPPDRICENATLRSFWLNGTTVLNADQHHPSVELNLHNRFAVYPDTGTDDNRWSVLTCDVNTPPYDEWYTIGSGGRPDINTAIQIKVWAHAVSYNGDYLLYVWTPCLMQDVTVTVPGFGDVVVHFDLRPWLYLLLGSDGSVSVLDEATQARRQKYRPRTVDEQVQ